MTIITIDEINKIVGMQLGFRKVNEQDRLVEDLGAESADIANLIAVVEEKYKVKIQEADIAKIFTPHDLFQLIISRVE